MQRAKNPAAWGPSPVNLRLEQFPSLNSAYSASTAPQAQRFQPSNGRVPTSNNNNLKSNLANLTMQYSQRPSSQDNIRSNDTTNNIQNQSPWYTKQQQQQYQNQMTYQQQYAPSSFTYNQQQSMSAYNPNAQYSSQPHVSANVNAAVETSPNNLNPNFPLVWSRLTFGPGENFGSWGRPAIYL